MVRLEKEKQNKLAVELLFAHFKVPELIKECRWSDDFERILLNVISLKGLTYRTVSLNSNWFKTSSEVMIGYLKSGETVLLIPKAISGYTYINCADKKKYTVTKEIVNVFEDKAYAFYKGMTKAILQPKDFLNYAFKSVPYSKYVLLCLSYLTTTLLGLVLPVMNQNIFNTVIPSGASRLLIHTAAVLIGIAVSAILFIVINHTILYNIRNTIAIYVETMIMERVMALPASFFREYSSGDISKRLYNFISVFTQILDTVFSTLFPVMFSVVYMIHLLRVTPPLAVSSAFIILMFAVIIVLFVIKQIHIYQKLTQNDVKVASIFFSLVTAIQKIKLAGAEEKAFRFWEKKYIRSAEILYNPPFILKIQPYIGVLILYFASIINYYVAALYNISLADFFSFTVIFGMITSSFTALIDISVVIAQFYSVLYSLKPIFQTKPDQHDEKLVSKELKGNIRFKNLSFKYNNLQQDILRDFSFTVKQGDFIAITGRTGCGKSTLLRLILGFEKAQQGDLFFDDINICDMNIKHLRRQIGTVLQDGKLLADSIYANITFFEPGLTMTDAWEAAEIAHIASDIRKMPMGMLTIISEGDGAISSGQKQRILIARAVIKKPRILILDEATSSLDNITQEKVTKSLSELDCTKIVVAHRLSTIQQCSTILLLEDGQVIESGTYDSLMNNKRFFYELVKRQKMNVLESDFIAEISKSG